VSPSRVAQMQGLLKKHRVKKPTVIKLTAAGALGKAADEGDDSDDEGGVRASVAGGKSGGGGKSQTRYFVLQGGLLRYYGAASAEPKGVLDLACAANMMGGDDGFNPMSRLSTVGKSGDAAKEVRVTAAADGLGFSVLLPNGTELDAAALQDQGEQERDDWVYALRAVVETTRYKSGQGRDKNTRESVAFASMSADEAALVEDHKRRIFRNTRYLF
jgi:hypothetical protein